MTLPIGDCRLPIFESAIGDCRFTNWRLAIADLRIGDWRLAIYELAIADWRELATNRQSPIDNPIDNRQSALT